MLRWSEWTAARVILHELTHATIWLPGSVNFNESVANFVGDVAALKFLKAKYGPKSQTLERAKASLKDQKIWRILLQDLYQELSEVYTHPDFTDEFKRSQKKKLYASLPNRVQRAPFQYPNRYLALARQKWSNPRLMQFRTYNDNRKYFEALLQDNNDDVLKFMKAMHRIARQHRSPLKHLREIYGHLDTQD